MTKKTLFSGLLLGLCLWTSTAQAINCEAVRARYNCPADLRLPLHLSFDDGPAIHSHRVLDVLKRERIQATFFVLADKVDCEGLKAHCALDLEQDQAIADCENRAEQQCQQLKQVLVRAKREGHTIGSHSYEHLHYSTVDPQLRRDHFRLARLILNPYLTTSPPLFRLPYGDGWFNRNQSMATLNDLKQAGFRHIAWTLSAYDWDEKNQYGDKVLGNVMSQLCERRQGGVALFHDGIPGTAQGRQFTINHLQQWIPALRCVADFKPLSFFEKGYKPRR